MGADQLLGISMRIVQSDSQVRCSGLLEKGLGIVEVSLPPRDEK
jgi:hypothetical protein